MEKIFRFSAAYQATGWSLISISLFLFLTAFFLVNRATRPALAVLSLALLVFVGTGIYFLFLATTAVTLTNTTLIWQRGFSFAGQVQKTIPYSDILAVHSQANRLTIVTTQEEIQLVKQMENYAEFYTLLQQHVKPAGPQNIPFPIIIQTNSRWPYVLGVVAFLFLAVFIARVYPGATSERIFILLFFALSGLWGGYELVLKRPFQYTFTADHIASQSYLQTRSFPVTDIQSIQISQRTSSSRGFERQITQLVITLPQNQTFTVDETDTNYPLEQLQLLLKARYLP